QPSTGPEDKETAAPEVPPPENMTTTGHVVKEHRKRGHDGVDINAPPKVLRRDHVDPLPTKSTRGGKSLAAIELGMGSTHPVLASQGAPVDVSDPDPLSFADPQSRPSADVTQSSRGTAAVGDPESENTSFTSMAGSPKSIYQLKWGIKNGCLLDAPESCQDLVDHIAPPGYFSELRHLHNDDFLKQYTVNLARQVAIGSQLRLRFEQEAKPLKKYVAQVARRDKRIQARENGINNLETLLEAETNMKKAAENRSPELSKELESMQALFLDLQAAFEEFKQYEDNRVEQCCMEIDVRLDAMSMDFKEELYPHMLTVIAGRRDTVQLETAVNTISHEYLLEFTSEYGIPETLHPELLELEDRIVDFPEGKVGGGCPLVRGQGRIPPNATPSPWTFSKTGTTASFGWTRECSRPSWTDKRMLPKMGCRLRTYMDLFNLIHAPNPTKVKTGSRPRAAHEVPLLTLTANRVVEMEDPAVATDSPGVPSTIEWSPLDFAHEVGASDQGAAVPEVSPPEDVPAASAPEVGQAEEVAAMDPSVATESRKRGRDGADVNAPAKVLRRDHTDPRQTGSTHGGKSIAAIELGLASTRPVPALENAPAGGSDPDPLSFPDPQSRYLADIAQSSQGTTTAGDLESGNASFTSAVGSPDSIYRPEWSVPNGSMLDTPEACQDLVDHVAPPGYFSELRHLHNDDFLRQYNVNLARQVAMGSQLRLRFEQEAKLLRKSVAQVAHRNKRIQARELKIKNLKALLEAEADMKKAAEDKSAGLSQELEDCVSGSPTFSRVEQRCAEMDARLNALSIDFDEELYPHMLTAIAGRRDCQSMSEGLRHRVEHGQAQLSLESIEAYDPDAKAKYVAALQALKDLKYPLVDQLEGLKDAPMDVIMAALYLESDTEDDALQHICDLRPNSSQLTIPVYPEVRDPMNPWTFKEEMLLADAIAVNISCAEQKKKCGIVCRTYGVGSAHHARSDGIPVSVPTVVP
nr:hypothetical protein [Tanacetum cinerariifolium]